MYYVGIFVLRLNVDIIKDLEYFLFFKKKFKTDMSIYPIKNDVVAVK